MHWNNNDARRAATEALCTLQVTVHYNPRFTDPEMLAEALTGLLETSLSTPGVLENHGDVQVSDFHSVDEEFDG